MNLSWSPRHRGIHGAPGVALAVGLALAAASSAPVACVLPRYTSDLPGTGGASSTGRSTSSSAGSGGSDAGAGGTSPGDDLSGTVWYVRKDGGDRTQCTGLADAPYPGVGGLQACAFGDVRYLWTDGTYGNKQWVIAGGDAVVVRDGPWRVGYDGPNTNDYFGNDPGNPYGAGPPPIPSGSAAHPTRFFGEHWANCTAKTQLHGGYAVGVVLALGGSQNVHVECLELTDHAQCIRVGAPVVPAGCSSQYPLDDYATAGIVTDENTSDVLLKNLDLHGFTNTGISGPIGGPIEVENVRIAYNGSAGWNLDDGKGTPDGPNAKITATDLTVEWNGCNEEYPVTHDPSAISCYDRGSAGYGEGFVTPNTQLDFTCDHCVFRYNTQDGLDLGNVSGSEITISNSRSYGNMARQWTLGAVQNITFENNLTVHDCRRLSAPIGDAPASFDANLSDFCRPPGDAFALSFLPTTAARFVFNTVVAYGSTTMFDVACAGACPTTGASFQDNIVYGYPIPQGMNPKVFGSASGMPFGDIGHNIYFNTSACPTSADPTAKCIDPKLASTPPWTGEATLDDIDLHLGPNSPAIAAGAPVAGVTTDYAGKPRPTPPSIGAYEPGSP